MSLCLFSLFIVLCLFDRRKAASAAQCRGSAMTSSSDHSSKPRADSSSGGGSRKQQWRSPDNAPAAAAGGVVQQLAVAYLPAGEVAVTCYLQVCASLLPMCLPPLQFYNSSECGQAILSSMQ
jgi:hypothetical protein